MITLLNTGGLLFVLLRCSTTRSVIRSLPSCVLCRAARKSVSRSKGDFAGRGAGEGTLVRGGKGGSTGAVEYHVGKFEH